MALSNQPLSHKDYSIRQKYVDRKVCVHAIRKRRGVKCFIYRLKETLKGSGTDMRGYWDFYKQETVKKRSMNIHAKAGHLVTVTEQGMNNGYQSDKDHAKKYLSIGEVYTIERTVVDNWHTDVYLNEIPGIVFNSVHFINYEK